MPARIIEEAPIEDAEDQCVLAPQPHITTANDVVISGIACRLPESDNMAEFREHLVKGEDMVTEDGRRWEPGLHGLPKRSGKLKDVTKFDAAFFGVHPKQANAMDPQLRMLLEVTQEAIVDSGVNPASIRGSRTGVFVGCSASEAHEAWSTDMENMVGYAMTGCTRSMFANRLSYFFDFKGPSYAIDTACSSSLLALNQALYAMRDGQCDSAIVSGCNTCLNPANTMQFMKLGMLSPEGTCKSFDASGNGYCRSEGIVSVFLQKAATAKRIYATVVHSKTNSDGHKREGITFPSGEVQKELVREVYEEAKVDPAEVAYVEAHGTGTKAGDPQEANTIVEVFCKKGRQGPLLIGSTKSNMGHPEPASGLAALAKCLIAMEDGYIPANLHYNNPNPDIPALSDGRLQVVTERTRWPGGYIGINSFGFGGSNVHVLLHSNQNCLAQTHSCAKDVRLLTFCGRTESAVDFALNEMKTKADNVELQTLVQEYANTPPGSLPYRGYTLLNSDGGAKEIEKCSPEDKQLWYIFAGMGTQWNGMGRDLMGIDVFRNSILRSDAVLKPYNIALYEMLMHGDDKTFDCTLNSFVGIAAIQVALVDVLRTLGLEPDGIVGHSVGELGCAYADGGLTAEETVLAAYWRGRCVTEAKLPPGGMAAVGLTWQEAKERCPEGVVPACHNAEDTVTISGPAEAVSKFVAQLKEEGIFAKEVKSAGVAFHSYYMANTAPALKEALGKVIKEPRRRSSRWISSSIPESRWHENLAKFSSADYHVNNLVSPVLFQEALQHVPKDAITIEIAPHCLLQAILKRSLGSGCTFVGLMKRNHPNNLEFLLSSLGKCYMVGAQFKPLNMYPKVHFPVSRGTPMISPLLQWDHSQSWDVPTMEEFGCGPSGRTDMVFQVDASPESEDHYLVGHKIDGRVLFPATGYLVLAWRALAKLSGQVYEQMPVVFEAVHIHRATILPKTGSVKFEVGILQGSGDFEVSENGNLVVSGKIYVPSDPSLEIPKFVPESSPEDADLLPLTTGDIYKDLRLRGYDYGPSFQGILESDNRGVEGQLLWNNNWVSFLDTMLQMSVLGLPGRSLRLPTRIKSVKINPAAHLSAVTEIDENKNAVKVTVDRELDSCVAGGVEMLGLHATVAPKKQQQQTPVLEQYCFHPYVQLDLHADKADLQEYLADCKKVIASALHKLLHSAQEESAVSLPNVEILKHFAKEEHVESSILESEEGGLMKLLADISSQTVDANFTANVANLLKMHRDNLRTDKLLNILMKSDVLKPCVDLALENSVGNKMKIVEIGASKVEAFRTIVPMLNTQPMVQVNYTVVDRDVNVFDETDLNSLNVSAVQWDESSDLPSSLSQANLVIMNHILSQVADVPKVLLHIKDLIKDDGFIIINEHTKNFSIPLVLSGLTKDFSQVNGTRTIAGFCDEITWLNIFSLNGLEVVTQKSDGLLSTIFVLRKTCETVPEPTVINISDLGFEWLPKLQATLQEYDSRPAADRIWLVADSEPSSGIVGMANCLRQEPGGDRIRCIFNAHASDKITFPELSSQLLHSLQKKNLVMNVFKDGQWGSFRHLPVPSAGDAAVTAEHAYVNVLTRGDLSSLRWIESPLRYFDAENIPQKELCSVYYTSLNFRDVMLATGKLPPDAIPGDMASQDCILGMEFSGRDQQGRRIMGLLPAKGLATTVDVDRRFLWSVPDEWNLEEAASVPVVYATVYYALVVRGRIAKGDRVLIHSGSGGVGQAAIGVALHHGCEVFTTCGSKEKKEFLKQRFPQLTDRHFANSRDRTFEWDILRATRGKGVDVVLNSLAEEKLMASVRILAPHGRFLEIGKFDLSNNTPLGMSVFLRNITFHGILLDALFEEGNRDWHVVADLLTEGIKSGAVRPLQTTTFDKDDIEGAFRFMAQGKHIGKVVVKVRDEEEKKCQCPSQVSIAALPRTACHPNKSYIITGGLGGFGLELAQWLVDRGAKYLVLTSRSGIRNGYQSRKVRSLREQGVVVKVSKHNVRTARETEDLLKYAAQLRPVGGIFHLAMVLRDGLFENQTLENFEKVGEPKVMGTHNLDRASRELTADSLDWFVVFSSVSCGRGNAGQTNYGFANSTMERICEMRKQDGFPGLAIQWGAIGDVGVVLENMGDNDTVIGGTLPQRINSCLATLDHFLNQPYPVVSSLVLAETASSAGADAAGKADLVASVAHILGVKDVSSLNPDTTLGDLGLDSLMGVEVKQALERDHDLVMPMKEIRLLTVNKLKAIAGESGSNKAPSVEKTQKSTTSSSVAWRYNLPEIMPRQEIVELKQGKGCPLFVIHPLEGSVICLKELAARMSCPVYGLQFTKDAPHSSIPNLAQHYLQLVKKTQPQGPYRLAGYSFGACVAFEMSLQLQKENRASSNNTAVIFLDGSHSYVAAHTQVYKAKMEPGTDEVQTQTQILCTFVMQFLDIDYKKLNTELEGQASWKERVAVAVQQLMATGHFPDAEDLSAAMEAYYHKLEMADGYRPAEKLESDVLLVRAQAGHQEGQALGDDFGLNQVCSGKISTHFVDGDHETFIMGESASKVAGILETH